MRTSKTIKYAIDNTDIASIGTTFNAGKYSTINLSGGPFLGAISGVVIQLKNISLATTLTMRVCSEDSGDVCVITDTDSSIAPGVTTPTKGTADYRAAVDFKIDTGTVYVFCKTNTGTCDIESVTITWEQ
jgi:hypothetical protein